MKAIKDSAIYLVGELISKSVPFLLLPYLSRKLGVEGFGELSYLQTFIALFAIFIGLSQDGAVARYFYAYGKRSLNLIINTGYIYTLSLTSVLLIISLVVKSEIFAYLVLIAASQNILSVQLSLRQCQKKAVSYTVIQLSSTVLSALLTIVMLEIYSEDLVEKRIVAMLLSNIIISLAAYFFYGDNRRKRKLNISNFRKSLLYILAFGGPMILHHGSFFIKGQLDRVFIYHKFSDVDLGIYAMGAQLASVFSILILAINKAMVPYLFDGLKSNNISIKKLHAFSYYSLLLVPIPTMIVLFIPDFVFSLFLGDEFVYSKYYFSIFILSYMLTIPYLFLVNYLFFLGETRDISICSLFSVFVYILSLFLFSFFGIEYIPIASVLSSISLLYFIYRTTLSFSL